MSADLERRASSIVNQAYRIVEGFMCDEKHKDIVDNIVDGIVKKNVGINKSITPSAGRTIINNVKNLKDSLCEQIRHEILGSTEERKELIDTAVSVLSKKNSTEDAVKAVREKIADFLFSEKISPKVNYTYLETLANELKYDLIDTGLVSYKELIERFSGYAVNPIVERFVLVLNALRRKTETRTKPSKPSTTAVKLPTKRPVEERSKTTATPVIPRMRHCVVIKDYLVLSDRRFPGYSPQTLRKMVEEVLRGTFPSIISEMYQGYALDLLPPDKLQLLRQIPNVKELPNPEREVINPGYPSNCSLDIFGAYRLDLGGFAVYTRALLLDCLKRLVTTQVQEGRMNATYISFFDSNNRAVYKIDNKLNLPNIALLYTTGDNVRRFGNAVADLMTVLARYRYNLMAFDYLSALAWGLVYDFYTIGNCLSSVT
jgi:hypothetical protein